MSMACCLYKIKGGVKMPELVVRPYLGAYALYVITGIDEAVRLVEGKTAAECQKLKNIIEEMRLSR